MEDKLVFDLQVVKADLIDGIRECSNRGLTQSGKILIFVFVSKVFAKFLFVFCRFL